MKSVGAAFDDSAWIVSTKSDVAPYRDGVWSRVAGKNFQLKLFPMKKLLTSLFLGKLKLFPFGAITRLLVSSAMTKFTITFETDGSNCPIR